MDGATGVLIKLGIRLLIFGAVFFFAARRNPKVLIHTKWATPIVAFTFAALNTGLYWALKPILDLATLGALGFFMPFIVNMVLLVVTVKFFAWEKMPHVGGKPGKSDDKAAKPEDAKAARKPLFEIAGIMTTLWMALVLTAAHGVLWVALDYIPSR
jgi:hypothetical protein